MRISYVAWLVVLMILAGCAGAGGAPANPVPTSTPEPWRAALEPVTLENVTNIARLGVNRSIDGTTYHMDFSDDGQRLLTVSGDNAVRVWDIPHGQVTWTLEGAETSRAFFALADTTVLLVTRDRTIKIYSLDDRTQVRSFEGHPSNIGPSAVSPDGRWLALGAEDGSVFVWDLAAEDYVYRLQAHIFPVRELYFSPDSSLLLTVSAERIVRLWDLATGEVLHELTGFDSRPYIGAFSSDGEYVVVSAANDVRVWAGSNGVSLQVIPTAARAAVRSITMTTDGRLLGGGEYDTVFMWDVITGDLLASLPDHGQDFHELVLHPGEEILITLSRPGKVYLWDMTNPNQRVQIGAVEENVSMAGWTPDGRILVLAAADGTMHFWGIPGEPITADN